MEKSSSHSFTTPMISSTSFSDSFYGCDSSTTLGTDDHRYDKQHVERLVEEQVAKAMDRFYRIYGESLNKLESLVLEELVPRLDSSRGDHEVLLQRVMRRLEKVRPMLMSFKAGLQSSSTYCQDMCDKPKRCPKDKMSLFTPTPSLTNSLRSCFSAMLRYESNPKNPSLDAVLRSLTSSDSTLTNSPSLLQLEAENARLGPDDVTECIYQNSSFTTPPTTGQIGDSQLKSDNEKTPQSTDMTTVQVEPSEEEVKKINKRLLKTNLMYKKSAFSLYLNRFKYPPAWPLPEPRRSKSAIMPKTAQPPNWESN